MTPAGLSAGLFILDMGATTHISTNHTDFLKLCPIAPRSIKGISSLSIYVVGIGKVKLSFGQGYHIDLDNVLFVLNASVHLISVSSLCMSENLVVSFDACTCWLTKRSGQQLVVGTLSAHHSYTLNNTTPPVVHHALLSHGTPDVGTWHCQLGHANIRTIMDMARNEHITCMHIDLSTEPSTCESCILGKQTRTAIPKRRKG